MSKAARRITAIHILWIFLAFPLDISADVPGSISADGPSFVHAVKTVSGPAEDSCLQNNDLSGLFSAWHTPGLTERDAAPLDSTDFIAYTDDRELEEYDNDILKYLQDKGEYYGFCHIKAGEKEEGTVIDLTTFRGIEEDDTAVKLTARYGEGVPASYNAVSDPVGIIAEGTGREVQDMFRNECAGIVFYNYLDQYQLVFHISSDDTIMAISYLNGIGYRADSKTIAAVQKQLNELGINSGAADGIMGPRTERAIKTFQKENQIEETGVIDDVLLKSLRDQGKNGKQSQSKNG